MRIIPTILFPDGSILVEPSNTELAQKLGLQTRDQRQFYDVIVIGNGPAGLTAALYLAREGKEVLVIEKAGLGGQAGITQTLDNYPGFDEGIPGAEFGDRLGRQARRFEVEILQANEVADTFPQGPYLCAISSDGVEYGAKAILLATGARYRRLDIPGEDELIGTNIHFCATCDAVFVFIGLSPNRELVKSKVEIDRFGFIVTDKSLMTSVPGLFAAGDVRLGSTKQAASAAGEGATDALMIREYLKENG